VTTNEEDGYAQAQRMQSPKIAVGDTVRLKAGTYPMKVVALEDYGNKAVCEGVEDQGEEGQETYPVSSLVKVG